MTEGLPVRSSEYFRAQARLYRDISQMMSDRQASERAMAFATECLERAEESERQEQVALEHSPEQGHS
jgi:hypothetical protein